MPNSPSGDERRTIEELATRYELEPTLRDVYVEGDFDIAVVSEALKQAGCHNAAVYDISTVEIPHEILIRCNLPDGNKGRVIALCHELNAHLAHPHQVTGLVDRDYDKVVGRVYVNPLLLFTDYACMEMYLFEEPVLERFCRLFIRKNGGLAGQLLGELEPILQDLFFIRSTNEILNLGLSWLDADKQCTVRNGVLAMDRHKFIHKYLNKNSKLSEINNFYSTLQSIREKPCGDARHQMNGHDFVRLLAKRLHAIVRNKNISDADVIERVLPGHADYNQLIESPMFSALILRVSS